LRADAWKLLLSYTPLNINLRESTIKKKRLEYFDICKIYDSLLENPLKTMNEVDYKTFKQISVDVPRTMPEFKIFGYESIRKLMLRVLFIWSMRHPASGYVQGFNDLISPFITVFLIATISKNTTEEKLKDLDLYALDFSEEFMKENGINETTIFELEADTYWCFSKMMDKVQSNYTNNQPGLQKMMSKMEEIIKLLDIELVKHLQMNEVSFMQFSFRWMNCYLMREFSLKLIIRLWDTYFSEENAFNNFHLFVCACLLLNFGDKIKKLEFQETIMFLQNLPTSAWSLADLDMLIAKSYQASVLYGNCSFLK